jgi:hypothetical protein
VIIICAQKSLLAQCEEFPKAWKLSRYEGVSELRLNLLFLKSDSFISSTFRAMKPSADDLDGHFPRRHMLRH